MKILLTILLTSLTLSQIVPATIPSACTSACKFNTISVTGNGKISATPDIATISLRLEKSAADTKGAVQSLVSLQNQIVSFLGRFGISSSSYSISSFNVYQGYSAQLQPFDSPNNIGITPNPTPVSSGTQVASEDFSIKINPFASSPVSSGTLITALIDGLAAKAGVQLNSISYDVADKTSSYTQTRALAYNDALNKAKDYASALGVTIGAPITLTDSFSSNGPVFYNQNRVAFAAAAEAYTPTSISVGNVDISYNIDAVFKYA